MADDSPDRYSGPRRECKTCGDEENAVFWSEEIQTIFVLPTPA